jgi:DNA-binding MarR family transcriptional regulator
VAAFLRSGFLSLSDSPHKGRMRIVRFTKRGHAAYEKIYEILQEIEREWSAELGSKAFTQLKDLLTRVWESPLTHQATAGSPEDE